MEMLKQTVILKFIETHNRTLKEDSRLYFEMLKENDMENLEEDYYLINGSKKILYWRPSTKTWHKPLKDSRGVYSGLIKTEPEKINVKSVILTELK